MPLFLTKLTEDAESDDTAVVKIFDCECTLESIENQVARERLNGSKRLRTEISYLYLGTE
jgi:hypothetical protein